MEHSGADISIAGPGSPVSLKKLFKEQKLEYTDQHVTVLLDQSGVGIVNDEESVCTIKLSDCQNQTRWFRDEVFLKTGKRPPLYLLRYLLEFYHYGEYKSDQELMQAVNDKTITADSPGYKHVQNLIEYSEHNPESMQLIGLFMLLEGSLSLAKKENKRVRFYLEYPDAHLHPSRAQMFMYVLNKLTSKYAQPLSNEELKAADSDEQDDDYDD